jgi:RNA polymerase sigma-70 factor (ECF subfamily)
MQSDRALIDAVIGGVPGAADEFVLRFSRYVYAILLRGVGLPEENADELFQDLFVHLWEDGFRRLRLWQGQDNFAAYLAPIVKNLAVSHVRKLGRQPVIDPVDGEPFEELARREPTPEELAAVEEQRRHVEQAVSELGERERRIYRLRFVEQKKHREIAEELSMTVSAVGVALARLERKLNRKVPETLENKRISRTERATVRSGGAEASPDQRVRDL